MMDRDKEWRRPVVLSPLVQSFPELGLVREFRSKQLVLTDDDSKQLLGVVSGRYHLLAHSRAAALVQDAIADVYQTRPSFSVRSMRRGAQAHFIFDLPWLEPLDFSMPMRVQLQVFNSYDGSWAFRIVPTVLREGASSALRLSPEIGVIKSKHLARYLKVGCLGDELSKMISNVEKMPKIWEGMQERQLSFEEAVALVKNQPLPKKFLDSYVVADRFPKTLWSFYIELADFIEYQTRSYARSIELESLLAKIFYPA